MLHNEYIRLVVEKNTIDLKRAYHDSSVLEGEKCTEFLVFSVVEIRLPSDLNYELT